mmetsp:Transcript_73167/g.128921  ORF Transcript_73167/g.128921 Transcript_73167/m.128921 type:complete len:228 (+) Transcript_73167:1873-2556(+)
MDPTQTGYGRDGRGLEVLVARTGLVDANQGTEHLGEGKLQPILRVRMSGDVLNGLGHVMTRYLVVAPQALHEGTDHAVSHIPARPWPVRTGFVLGRLGGDVEKQLPETGGAAPFDLLVLATGVLEDSHQRIDDATVAEIGIDEGGVAHEQPHGHAQLHFQVGRMRGVVHHFDEQGHQGTVDEQVGRLRVGAQGLEVHQRVVLVDDLGVPPDRPVHLRQEALQLLLRQ